MHTYPTWPFTRLPRPVRVPREMPDAPPAPYIRNVEAMWPADRAERARLWDESMARGVAEFWARTEVKK